jgi:hypothetical protein
VGGDGPCCGALEARPPGPGSLVGTAMFRMKTSIGGGVASRYSGRQATEAGVRGLAGTFMTSQETRQSRRIAYISRGLAVAEQNP